MSKDIITAGNYSDELEQQKAELIEFAKDSIYMTIPELWNKRNELLKKHGVEI